MGRGKREAPAFSLFPSSSARFLAGASVEERVALGLFIVAHVTPNAPIILFNVKVILTLCKKQLFTKLLELLRLLLNLYLGLKKKPRTSLNEL